MKHPARWVALAVGCVVAALSVVLAVQVGDDQRQRRPRSELLGDPAPAFDLPTLGGDPVTNAELRGRAVIVNFWNSWCIPCRQEEPALKELHRRHSGEADFTLLGIVRDDSTRAARGAVTDRDIEWTMALDPGSRAALDFGTRGQPETYAISPDGVIVGTQFGPATVENLETLLAAARGQRA
jgi:cytochrome c biogenesis protein CcmG, thiol:disulfide interchange protein DsbE